MLFLLFVSEFLFDMLLIVLGVNINIFGEFF